MTEAELRKLQMQQEAHSAALARINMQIQAQNARHNSRDEEEEEEAPPQRQPQQQPPQQQPPQQQYQGVDPNALVLQAITNQAANIATQKVQQNLTATSDVESKIKSRMTRLVADYPALQDEGSDLVTKSREVYARITAENPSLDEATKYELAAREAASVLGVRPVNSPIEDYARSDYLMPTSNHRATGSKSTKSRLTPNIIANAKLMGINVNPDTPEGKKNLAELSEYSARFNADQDETAFRYK